MELNPKIKVVILIIIILFVLSGLPVKIIKGAFTEKEIIQVNETPTITIYETIEILVTPTPDGNKYFASEYQEGIRKINRPFSLISENSKDGIVTSIHAVVYDYKIFNRYHWFNPTDSKYYEENANLKHKFIFVFFNIYQDDVIGEDTRFWVPSEKQMILRINNVDYRPIESVKQIRIRELEETFNLNDDSRVVYFNTKNVYSRSTEHRDTAGETFYTIDVLKGGQSNAIDGYLIFEIPYSVKDEDILFGCNFYTWGNSFWKLKP